MNPLAKLLAFLGELDRRKIFYTLSRPRDEAIMVEIAVPGERWEVEFFADGHVEVETFRSQRAGLAGEEALDDLFARHSDH